jgi:putative transposase
MKQHHKNVRLPHYDYSSVGSYFVTVAVEGRACCLARISGERHERTDMGEAVVRGWQWLAEQYSYVVLDEFIVMPNHFHGILIIEEQEPAGARLSLGRLISAFKARTTRDINRLRNTPGKTFWQKDFYEHVIRGERDLAKIRDYIVNNPMQWAADEENPDRRIP